MPSSTSNSKTEANGTPARAPIQWGTIGRRIFFILLGLTVFWEGLWRLKGFVPTHKDDVALWADERDRLRTAGPDSIAVVGSSRIFYGLESDLVRKDTGRPVIQLAVNGMSPLPVLEELAADESFSGVALTGISLPALFGHEKYTQKAEGWMRGYRRLSSADRINHQGHMLLEKLFVYPSKEEFGLQLLMIFQILTSDEPHTLFDPGSTQLSIFDEKRGSYMTDFVVRSKSVREAIIGMQLRDFGTPVAATGQRKAEILKRMNAAIAKIQARGGKVVFVQYPSGGKLAHLEAETWPRADYWEKLAEIPGTTAIHFEDHAGLTGFVCIEDSHLSRPDRIKFTAALLEILKEREIF